jgi:hypothetical protein
METRSPTFVRHGVTRRTNENRAGKHPTHQLVKKALTHWATSCRCQQVGQKVDATAHVATVLQDEFENFYTLPI